MQAEQRFNVVLDLCAKNRDEMAAVSDHLSLGTAFRTLWDDLEEEASPWCAPTCMVPSASLVGVLTLAPIPSSYLTMAEVALRCMSVRQRMGCAAESASFAALLPACST